MPNGSHSTGPGWNDVIREDRVIELINKAIDPLKKRIEAIEKLLANKPLDADGKKPPQVS